MEFPAAIREKSAADMYYPVRKTIYRENRCRSDSRYSHQKKKSEKKPKQHHHYFNRYILWSLMRNKLQRLSKNIKTFRTVADGKLTIQRVLPAMLCVFAAGAWSNYLENTLHL